MIQSLTYLLARQSYSNNSINTQFKWNLRSSRVNLGAVFLGIFTVAFFLFLAPVGGGGATNPAGPIF